MKRAKSDLNKMLHGEPMKFIDFFPIFRDTILGLTYMHLKRIVHKDIKPDNIMQISQYQFVLVDYGVGNNLSTRE